MDREKAMNKKSLPEWAKPGYMEEKPKDKYHKPGVDWTESEIEEQKRTNREGLALCRAELAKAGLGGGILKPIEDIVKAIERAQTPPPRQREDWEGDSEPNDLPF